jgi:predicted GH43/DUF377 family glycosyl hydrolase
MKWKKLGLIFQPGHYPWMASHAHVPFHETLKGGLLRIHFSSRDQQNRARGGYFDFDIENPHQILNISENPTLELGPLGAFDDSGVVPNSIVEYRGKKYMYYAGWTKTVTVPFHFHIGLAISEDSGHSYHRYSNAPVLGRNYYDPYITGAPFVIKEGDIFKMWYVSATKWEAQEGNKPKHYYTIKYATSEDGISWNTSNHLCIPFKDEEYAIARPVVYKVDDKYNMWFTYRGGENTYRVGTATSDDGIEWQRADIPLGIDISTEGWDSEMICYAYPLEYKRTLYALYNGNGYGLTGIGLAVLED